MSARARAVAGGVLLAVLASASACGSSETTAGERVPALSRSLQTVDSALASHDYARARTAMQRIVTLTNQARDKGTLTDAQADRVLAAVARLMTALPQPTPTITPTPTPSKTPRDEGQKHKKKHEEKDEGHGD